MNQYHNLHKMMQLSDEAWKATEEGLLADLSVVHGNAPYMQCGDKHFINMCSCSYLGWDRHPSILEGAIEGVRRAGTLHLTTARCRLALDLLSTFEARLTDHFGATAIAYNACAAASNACLPILACGGLTGGRKPVMVFDKFAHFSLAHSKPICSDETQVITIENNDMETLEQICKRNETVAYISDATYSIEGFADIPTLLELQNRYGLFVYLDDSHGLSITGARGCGYALANLGQLNERTVVVASLAKAFGAAGGVLLCGHPEARRLLTRYGNPWSQYLNSAGIGGGLASLDLHESPELLHAQSARADNAAVFDRCFPTVNAGTPSAIRVVKLKDVRSATETAARLMNFGFYTSPVFFPVVPKRTAGLRIMPRADIDPSTMKLFCERLESECAGVLLEAQ